MGKKREPIFDNCKFFLILFVIVGHILETTDLQSSRLSKTIVTVIYSFHMPLFVFISGYFSKTTYSKKMLMDIVKNLILPYAIFQTIYLIFVELMNGETSIYLSYTTPFSMLWFTFCLIGWKLLLPFIHKSKFSLPVLLVAGIMIGYIPWVGNFATVGSGNVTIGAVYSLSRFFVFFPFFLIGSQMSRRKIPNRITRTHKYIAYAVFAAAIAFTAFFFDKINYSWFYGRDSYEKLGISVWYAGLYRIVSYSVSLLLCFAFLAMSPKSNIPIISNMGQRTIYPYLLHVFFIIALRAPVNYWAKMSEHGILIPIISGCALTLLLSSPIVQKVFRLLVEPSHIGIWHQRKDSPLNPNIQQ